MKKILSILAIAAAMVACSKEDSTTDVAPATYTLTGYSSLDTRTEFDTPSEDEDNKKIPFLWSEGDKILVLNEGGGTATEGEISAGASTSSATFSLTTASENGNTVYYNLNVKKGSLGMITADAAATANVQAEQRTTKNLGENGDFGYATVDDGKFKLNHATAYLWFDVKSLPDGYTLQSISFDAGEAKVAGEAKWNGEAFGEVTNGSSVIKLEVDENATMVAMVVLPANIETATITYELSNGTEIIKTLSGRTIASGKTYKISVDSAEPEPEPEYELRVLTFEDTDAKFEPYTLDYAGVDITTWSDLIDEPPYGGPLTYGDYMNTMYTWWDENNTELTHTFPYNYAYCFWGGGHAISNYWGEGYSDEDRDEHIAKYYGKDYVEENAGNDQMLGWFNLQLMTPVKAHSGDNFCVHYGYKDFFSYVENLPELSFADGEARVIDHMWVTNTNYTLNQLYNGVKSEAGNSFGGNWEGLTEDAWLKIIAQGFDDVEADADAEPISETEFYLVKGMNVVTDWQKWDLSELGPVAKVRFNFAYSDEMGGQYGFTIPGYFAYDDVAVRF